MTDLPSGFRYQGMDWKIVPADIDLALQSNLGETHHRSFEVKVFRGAPEPHPRQTLLHELMHVTENAFTPDDQPSESQIRVLAQGVYAILTDNPDLRHFIWPEESHGDS